jgi:hypothetical protein
VVAKLRQEGLIFLKIGLRAFGRVSFQLEIGNQQLLLRYTLFSVSNHAEGQRLVNF